MTSQRGYSRTRTSRETMRRRGLPAAAKRRSSGRTRVRRSMSQTDELLKKAAVAYARHFSEMSASVGIICAVTAIVGATLGSFVATSFALAGGLLAMNATYRAGGDDLPVSPTQEAGQHEPPHLD
jgi:hypothetical protein